MPIPEELSRKAEEVLKQIAELGPMRKGSLCWRVLKRKTKKGETRERGPYCYYTFKKNNRTHCKMISKDAEPLFKEQIERSRQFQKLTREYANISQQMADHEAKNAEGKKNSRAKSKKKKNAKSRTSSTD